MGEVERSERRLGASVYGWKRLACLVLLLCAACKAWSDPARAAREAPVDESVLATGAERASFEVVPARQGGAPPLPVVTARIAPVETLSSSVHAPLAGRVVSVRVRLGDTVKEGESLLLVRSAALPTWIQARRSAELSIRRHADRVERLRALVDAHAGAQHDLTLAEAELAEARLTLRSVRAQLVSLQLARGLDDTTYWVRASRSGTVVQLDAVPGALVGPGTPPIATLADLSEVLAIADVAPRDARVLQRGSAAWVTSAAGRQPVEGRITLIPEVLDPARQIVPVRIRLENAQRRLKPNAHVEVRFGPTGGDGRSVLVPSSAVVRDGATAVVFVQTESGALVRRPVVLGRGGQEVEILAGLEPGERVVVRNAMLLVNMIDPEA